ncbi:hypothetical protein SAMN05192543_102497 [Paraburkholderia megapolitana]|uniref:Uncharacterized protein n=2 Tax=Burkholderiaceae TaxID=119060 RepID=A0A1I3GFG4_9BURK|nr:hypothetical protein SAMN05192543_102497 [Paraburkholderia megapolitana]
MRIRYAHRANPPAMYWNAGAAMKRLTGWMLLAALFATPLAALAKVQGTGGAIADTTLEQARIERAHHVDNDARYLRRHSNERAGDAAVP